MSSTVLAQVHQAPCSSPTDPKPGFTGDVPAKIPSLLPEPEGRGESKADSNKLGEEDGLSLDGTRPPPKYVVFEGAHFFPHKKRLLQTYHLAVTDYKLQYETNPTKIPTKILDHGLPALFTPMSFDEWNATRKLFIDRTQKAAFDKVTLTINLPRLARATRKSFPNHHWASTVMSTYITDHYYYNEYFGSDALPVWGTALLPLLGLPVTQSYNSNLQILCRALSDLIRTLPDLVAIARPLHDLVVASTPHYNTRKNVFVALNAQLGICTARAKAWRLPTRYIDRYELKPVFCDTGLKRIDNRYASKRLLSRLENQIHLDAKAVMYIAHKGTRIFTSVEAIRQNMDACLVWLLLVSGSRRAELVGLSTYEASDESPDYFVQTHLAKKPSYAASDSFCKPCLIGNASFFLRVLFEWRKLFTPSIKVSQGKSMAKLLGDASYKLAKTGFETLWYTWARAPLPTIKIHGLRAVYGGLTYRIFGQHYNCAELAWVGRVLGHDLTSLATTAHYMTIALEW